MAKAAPDPAGQYPMADVQPWVKNDSTPLPTGHANPAGHVSQLTRPGPPLYDPALQFTRMPLMHISPGEHATASVRTDTDTVSGTEYHPKGTGVGSEEPAGQYTVALVPQGKEVSFVEPAGQMYPVRQRPEQLPLVSAPWAP